jgi:hypothetical protein
LCGIIPSTISRHYIRRRIITDQIISSNYNKLNGNSKDYWDNLAINYENYDYDNIVRAYTFGGAMIGALIGVRIAKRYPI